MQYLLTKSVMYVISCLFGVGKGKVYLIVYGVLKRDRLAYSICVEWEGNASIVHTEEVYSES